MLIKYIKPQFFNKNDVHGQRNGYEEAALSRPRLVPLGNHKYLMEGKRGRIKAPKDHLLGALVAPAAAIRGFDGVKSNTTELSNTGVQTTNFGPL